MIFNRKVTCKVNALRSYYESRGWCKECDKGPEDAHLLVCSAADPAAVERFKASLLPVGVPSTSVETVMTPDGSMEMSDAILLLEVAALDNMKVKMAQLERSYRRGMVPLDRLAEHVMTFRDQLRQEQWANDASIMCVSCCVIAGPHERFCDKPGAVLKSTPHSLSDGKRVTIGMYVRDYDNNIGHIARTENNMLLIDTHHDGAPRQTCSAWWDVEYDDGSVKAFDCSRMVGIVPPVSG